MLHKLFHRGLLSSRQPDNCLDTKATVSCMVGTDTDDSARDSGMNSGKDQGRESSMDSGADFARNSDHA